MKVEFANLEVYEVLLQVCSKYDADPGSSIEAEEYYIKLLQEYDGDYDMERLRKWLDERISKLYIAFEARPKWIQGEQWPFYNGQPMVFVGQIDITTYSNTEAGKYFHDDAAFYLFIGPAAYIQKVVVQQY